MSTAVGSAHSAANMLTSMDTTKPLSRNNAYKAAGLMNLANAGGLGNKINEIGQPILPGQKPPSPVPEAPVVMPLPDSAAVEAAKKKQADLLSAGGGRASTVLSQNDRLGG